MLLSGFEMISRRYLGLYQGPSFIFQPNMVAFLTILPSSRLPPTLHPSFQPTLTKELILSSNQLGNNPDSLCGFAVVWGWGTPHRIGCWFLLLWKLLDSSEAKAYWRKRLIGGWTRKLCPVLGLIFPISWPWHVNCSSVAGWEHERSKSFLLNVNFLWNDKTNTAIILLRPRTSTYS